MSVTVDGSRRRARPAARPPADGHLLGGLVCPHAFESAITTGPRWCSGGGTSWTIKLAALRVLTEHLLPGRWAQLRAPHRRELAATLVLAIPLDEWSVKVSEGPPDDPEEDLAEPVWAGVVPVVESYGPPVSAPGLSAGATPPRWATG